MKKIIAGLLILLGTSTPLWAAISRFDPTDAFVTAAGPTTNQNNINQVSGTFATNDGYFMKFDFSSIAGQTAIHAYLNIWTNRGGQHTNNIYRILRNYTTNQITYNVYSTGNNWTTAGALGSGTDYTTTNASTYVMQSAAYAQSDVTAMVNDCLAAGNTCNIEMRWNTPTFDVLQGVASANPPYIIVTTGTPGVPVPWYVRDGGNTYGNTSTTCNGTVDAVYTSGSGPNCAVNAVKYITGDGVATQKWIGGDILYVHGDSDKNFTFTVSGVTTTPGVGATYTNNGITYTVTSTTISGGAGTVKVTAAVNGGLPLASGTLTKSGGTGDATVTFSAYSVDQAQYGFNSQINALPAGQAGQQTKIIGTGSHYAQFYPTVSIFTFLDDTADYIDLENIEITQHDSCIKNGPLGPGGATVNPDGFNYVCAGGDITISTGIMIGGTGKTLTNVLVHRLYNAFLNNINGGVVGDITFTNVKAYGNSEQGMVIGNSQAVDNVMTGTITFINSQIDFTGCGEKYPAPDTADIYKNIATAGYSTSVDNPTNYYNCFGQGQNGYGDGVGFGPTGAANAGNWKFINTSTSFNTQDGVDTLHGNGNGTISFIRSRAEGNGGQQIKLNGKIEDVENSLINGDCQRWVGATESATTAGSTGGSATGFKIDGTDVCRAQGDTTLFVVSSGAQVYFYNNTIISNAIALEPAGGGCDATTGFHIKNNIIMVGEYAVFDTTINNNTFTGRNGSHGDFIYYTGSDGNGTGTCGPVGNGTGGVLVPDEDYNIVLGAKNNNAGCLGTHDKCGTDPGFIATIPTGTINVGITSYYTGVAMASLEPLGSTSAARGAASITGLTYTNGTNDYNNFALNSPPDIGGLQYGSSPQYCTGNGGTLATGGTCCSGFSSGGVCVQNVCGDGVVSVPEACDGSNLNSQTCVTQGFASGTLSCTACAFNTSSCVGTTKANGQSCSSGSECISGLCSGSLCVANICGNGVIEGSEVCDGVLLNNNTCQTQGFASGTLACGNTCLIFNTSSCQANTVGFNLGFGGRIGGT